MHNQTIFGRHGGQEDKTTILHKTGHQSQAIQSGHGVLGCILVVVVADDGSSKPLPHVKNDVDSPVRGGQKQVFTNASTYGGQKIDVGTSTGIDEHSIVREAIRNDQTPPQGNEGRGRKDKSDPPPRDAIHVVFGDGWYKARTEGGDKGLRWQLSHSAVVFVPYVEEEDEDGEGATGQEEEEEEKVGETVRWLDHCNCLNCLSCRGCLVVGFIQAPEAGAGGTTSNGENGRSKIGDTFILRVSTFSI